MDASQASQLALVEKDLPANVGDVRDAGWIPGLGRSPGEGHGNPLHCSYLENPMNGQRSLAGYSAKSLILLMRELMIILSGLTG